LDLSWDEHPFFASRLMVKTAKDIAIIKSLDANTAAFVSSATASAVQTEVLRHLALEVRYVAEWCDEHSGVHDTTNITRRPEPRRAGQYSLTRKNTEGDDR
jgi:hypothetical protein